MAQNQYGARSKTTVDHTRRQRKDSGTNRNRNYSSVNSNKDDGWGELPKTSTPAYTFNDIWDNIPSDPPPIENAWEKNKEVSGWSKRNRKFQTNSDNWSGHVQQEKQSWQNIDTEFPALERKPVVNVWKVREEKFLSKKAMEPTNENEEERMIRQAMELSKLEAERDEQRRRELEEEYKLQMHLMETNPLLFEEFRTDEELAMALSEMSTDVSVEENWNDDDDDFYLTTEEVHAKKKESRKPTYEDRYEEQNKKTSKNVKQQDLEPPSSNLKNSSRPAPKKTISASENKTKIADVVNLFGGWGQLEKKSQKPVGVESRDSIDTNPPSKLPADEKSLEKNEITWKQVRQNKRNVSENSTEVRNTNKLNQIRMGEDKGNSVSFDEKKRLHNSDDFGWQSDADISACEGQSEDKDWAWKSDDPVPNTRQENPIKTKAEEKLPSVKQKHSMKHPSDSFTQNCKLAKSISSEYADLASKCESTVKDHQNEGSSVFERKLPTNENVFDVLHEDYVKGTSQSPKSLPDPTWASSPQSLPNETEAVDDSSKLQFTDPEIPSAKNEISYSLKSVSKDVPNENGAPERHSSASGISDPRLLNTPTTEDDDISLPVFAPSRSVGNNLSSSLPSFASSPSDDNNFSTGSNVPMSMNPSPTLDPFPESLRAHFQQFQPRPVPMTPAFPVNPGFMLGMNQLIMMQQMMPYPMSPEIMNNFYKSMSAGFPMIPQAMMGVPNYQPMSNFTSIPPASSENFIGPPIPPPSQKSDLEGGNGISQFSPSPEASSESGNDDWLDRFLSKEPQTPIPPPMIPENGSLGRSAMNLPPATTATTSHFSVNGKAQMKPASAGDSGWLDEGDVGYPNASNDDWEAELSKSMRNSSRYVAERNKENRQPSSQPSFARGFRNGSVANTYDR